MKASADLPGSALPPGADSPSVLLVEDDQGIATVPGSLLRHARRARDACPTLALRLVKTRQR